MVESLKIELFTAQRELVEKQEECEMIEKEITLVRLSVIALYIILAQDNLGSFHISFNIRKSSCEIVRTVCSYV